MKIIFIVTALVMLVALGVVAVRNYFGEKGFGNFELSPDQFNLPAADTPAVPTVGVIVNADWKTFKSKDQSLRFRYPPQWEIIETSSSYNRKGVKGIYGVAVQSWVLTNFRYPPAVQGGGRPPEGAIKIDFEISTEGRKESVDNLLDCSQPEVTECKDLTVNGVTYKRKIAKNQGTESIMMATVKENRIYRISGTVSSDKNEKGIQEVEQVIGTLEIMQVS